MSLAAGGTLADAITFATWKGRPYVRERVLPSNPKSGSQVGRRSMFKFLSQAWDALAGAAQASWQTLADEIVASTFNAYLKQNMEYWHNFLPPSQGPARAGLDSPSDNALTAAAWEENRIKLSVAGTVLNEAWGIIIFGSLATPVLESVGLAIIVDPDTTFAAHDIFWTPPEVNTWYFDSMTFSLDGVLSAAGGEQSAVP